ncbi:hypothetical protein FDECE_8173 [Fusarium decemcellulare]|nr:hypothetical protein FDECE_8173 [Fusarium decemcellulare]
MSDILSQELRHFSQRDNLQHLFVSASVDSTILWPQSQDLGCKLPTWPTLSLFQVQLHDVLPSGQLIVMRDPKVDEDITYKPVHFERFALAAARAAGQMPKIKELYVTDYGSPGMGVGFVTSGFVKSCCLEFSGDPPPAPSEETMDAWRSVVNLHGLEWNVRIAHSSNAYYL